MQQHQQLIPVARSADGIQTVNARDLHAFLEVQTRYNDWIKARIEQYGFVEGDDFVAVTENLVSGGVQRTHHCSLDMAKELAMVERNAKGKQARQYFIECEKVAHSTPAAQALTPPKAFTDYYRVSRLIGLDRNVAAISANNATYKLTGTNVLQLLGQTHLDNPEQQLYYTPTELGARIGLSAVEFNQRLAAAGLQSKMGDKWHPSHKAAGLYRVLDTGKKRNDGTPIQQIKWSDKTLELIGAEAA